MEVYDYRGKGKPEVTWLHRKAECGIIINAEQLRQIKEDEWLRYLMKKFCERQRIKVKVQ